MIKILLAILVITVNFLLFFLSPAHAQTTKYTCIPGGTPCSQKDADGNAYVCSPSEEREENGKVIFYCQPAGVGKIFKSIKPPTPILSFIGKDPTGGAAISKFLTNLIQLIYIFAAIVLLFVLLWGAFDWVVSEGDKEKVAAAQRKIINAIIGIVLFAVAFAILRVLSQFTGFEFFQGALCSPFNACYN